MSVQAVYRKKQALDIRKQECFLMIKEKGSPARCRAGKPSVAAKRNDPFLSQLLLLSQLPERHDHDSTDQGQKTTEQHERHHLAAFL